MESIQTHTKEKMLGKHAIHRYGSKDCDLLYLFMKFSGIRRSLWIPRPVDFFDKFYEMDAINRNVFSRNRGN